MKCSDSGAFALFLQTYYIRNTATFDFFNYYFISKAATSLVQFSRKWPIWGVWNVLLMPLTEVDCPEMTAVSWILKSSLLTLCRHSNGRQITLQTFCSPTFSLCSLLGVTDAGLHTLVLVSSAIDLSPSVTPVWGGGGSFSLLKLIARLPPPPPHHV